MEIPRDPLGTQTDSCMSGGPCLSSGRSIKAPSEHNWKSWLRLFYVNYRHSLRRATTPLWSANENIRKSMKWTHGDHRGSSGELHESSMEIIHVSKNTLKLVSGNHGIFFRRSTRFLFGDHWVIAERYEIILWGSRGVLSDNDYNPQRMTWEIH